MIIKNYEIKKIAFQNNVYLFHGDNTGFKEEIINEIFKKKFLQNIFVYSEKEILANPEKLNNQIQSKSFFENEKLLIINDASDKIKSEIENIQEKITSEITLILISEILEKKSKLRNLFEKDKKLICVAFYPDTNQILNSLAKSFFLEKKVSISQQSLELLVNRANGDRKNLFNELYKIENFILNKKKLEFEDLIKLTNLSENHNISELVDFCLAKNKTKTKYIINENNFSMDDTIMIIRIFLAKAKRLLDLSKASEKEKDLDKVISNFKPPIFWKDKEIIKQQIKNWSIKTTQNLILEINQVELLIKKNSQNSLNILLDFIFKNTEINN
tara:strand:+ start:5019 stop:6008 length:990 start_codon:yes stop_codon:yes gene_type:complete